MASENKSWVSNAARAIGGAATKYLESKAQNTFAISSEIHKGVKTLSTSAKATLTKRSEKQIQNRIASNPTVKASMKAVKDYWSDIRRGHLFGAPDRKGGMYGGGSDDDPLGIGDSTSGTSFGGDPEAASPTINIDTGGAELQESIVQQTEAQLKIAESTINASIATTSAMMHQQQEVSNLMLGHLKIISEAMAALPTTFGTTAMGKFFETGNAYFTRKQKEETSSSYNENAPINVFRRDKDNKIGAINIGKYLEHVKREAKEAASSLTGSFALLKAVAGGEDGSINSNAIVGMIGSMISSKIMANTFDKSIGKYASALENKVNNIIPNFLMSLSDRGKNSDSSVVRTLAKIFGLDFDIKSIMTTKGITNKATDFDEHTKNSIVTVIPKYLSEISQYTRTLVGVVGNMNDQQLDTIQSKSQRFNVDNGKYETTYDITKSLLDKVYSSASSELNSSLLAKALDNIAQERVGTIVHDDPVKQDKERSELLNSYEDMKKMLAMIMYQNGGNMDIANADKSDNDIYKSLASLGVSENQIRTFTRDIARLGKSKSIQMDMQRIRPSLYNNVTDTIKDLENNQIQNQFYDSALTDPRYQNKTLLELMTMFSVDPSSISLRGPQGGYEQAGVEPPPRPKPRPKPSMTQTDNTLTQEEQAQIRDNVIDQIRNGKKRRRRGPQLQPIGDTPQPSSQPISGELDESIYDSILEEINKNHPAEEIPVSVTNVENRIRTKVSDLANNKDKTSGKILRALSTGNMEAVSEVISDAVKGTAVSVGNYISENVFKPASLYILGEKDETNHRREGLLSGVANRITDIMHSTTAFFSGKEWVDRDGNLHQPDEETSIGASIKGALDRFKESANEYLFGDEIRDVETGDLIRKEGLIRRIKKTGSELLSDITGDFKHFFYGDLSDLSEEEREKKIQETNENVKKDIKNSAMGAGIGAAAAGGLGLITSALPFGGLLGGIVNPFMGAGIGAVVGFMKNHQGFQRFLFGGDYTNDKGEEVHQNGLISKQMQDAVKKSIKPAALAGIGGAGALKVAGLLGVGSGSGAISGVLGTIVANPLMGAAVAASAALITKTSAWSTFINGDPDKGILGIKDYWKKAQAGRHKDALSGTISSGIKTVGYAGALGGAGWLAGEGLANMGLLGSFFSPAGPVGGALIGTVLGLKLANKHLHTFLFGKDYEDEEGNTKHEEGVIGRFNNAIAANLIMPLRDIGASILSTLKFNIEHNILATTRIAFFPLTKALTKVGDLIYNKLNSLGDNLKDGFNTYLWQPIKLFTSNLLSPIAKFLNGIGTKLFRGLADGFGALLRHSGNLGGGILARFALTPEEREERKEQKKIAAKERKDAKIRRDQEERDRKDAAWNRKQILKQTKGSMFLDTEDNREEVNRQLAAKGRKTIKFRGREEIRGFDGYKKSEKAEYDANQATLRIESHTERIGRILDERLNTLIRGFDRFASIFIRKPKPPKPPKPPGHAEGTTNTAEGSAIINEPNRNNGQPGNQEAYVDPAGNIYIPQDQAEIQTQKGGVVTSGDRIPLTVRVSDFGESVGRFFLGPDYKKGNAGIFSYLFNAISAGAALIAAPFKAVAKVVKGIWKGVQFIGNTITFPFKVLGNVIKNLPGIVKKGKEAIKKGGAFIKSVPGRLAGVISGVSGNMSYEMLRRAIIKGEDWASGYYIDEESGDIINRETGESMREVYGTRNLTRDKTAPAKQKEEDDEEQEAEPKDTTEETPTEEDDSDAVASIGEDGEFGFECPCIDILETIDSHIVEGFGLTNSILNRFKEAAFGKDDEAVEGGEQAAIEGEVGGGITTAEVWNPETGEFETVEVHGTASTASIAPVGGTLALPMLNGPTAPAVIDTDDGDNDEEETASILHDGTTAGTAADGRTEVALKAEKQQKKSMLQKIHDVALGIREETGEQRKMMAKDVLKKAAIGLGVVALINILTTAFGGENIITALGKFITGTVAALGKTVIGTVSDIGSDIAYAANNNAELGRPIATDSVVETLGNMTSDIGDGLQNSSKLASRKAAAYVSLAGNLATEVSKSGISGIGKYSKTLFKETVEKTAKASKLEKAWWMLNPQSILTSAERRSESIARNTFGSTLMTAGTNKIKSSLAGDAASAATTTALATIDQTSSSSKILTMVKSGFSKIIDTLKEKFNGMIEDTLFEKFLQGSTWKKISGTIEKFSVKIWTKFTSAKAVGVVSGVLTAGLGFLITELGQVTLGALNGLTGAAQLFHVNESDTDFLMVLISGALGALANTTPGIIIDIVNEVVAETTGVDMIREVAVFIYRFINEMTGNSQANEDLEDAVQKFRDQYDSYKESELKKQYATYIKATGSDAEEFTYADYLANIKDGTMSAAVMTETAYNKDQHQTIGSRIGAAVGNVASAVGTGLSNTLHSWTGRTMEVLVDYKGQTIYQKIGDSWHVLKYNGTALVDIGTMPEENIPANLVKRTVKIHAWWDADQTDELLKIAKDARWTSFNEADTAEKIAASTASSTEEAHNNLEDISTAADTSVSNNASVETGATTKSGIYNRFTSAGHDAYEYLGEGNIFRTENLEDNTTLQALDTGSGGFISKLRERLASGDLTVDTFDDALIDQNEDLQRSLNAVDQGDLYSESVGHRSTLASASSEEDFYATLSQLKLIAYDKDVDTGKIRFNGFYVLDVNGKTFDFVSNDGILLNKGYDMNVIISAWMSGMLIAAKLEDGDVREAQTVQIAASISPEELTSSAEESESETIFTKLKKAFSQIFNAGMTAWNALLTGEEIDEAMNEVTNEWFKELVGKRLVKPFDKRDLSKTLRSSDFQVSGYLFYIIEKDCSFFREYNQLNQCTGNNIPLDVIKTWMTEGTVWVDENYVATYSEVGTPVIEMLNPGDYVTTYEPVFDETTGNYNMGIGPNATYDEVKNDLLSDYKLSHEFHADEKLLTDAEAEALKPGNAAKLALEEIASNNSVLGSLIDGVSLITKQQDETDVTLNPLLRSSYTSGSDMPTVTAGSTQSSSTSEAELTNFSPTVAMDYISEVNGLPRDRGSRLERVLNAIGLTGLSESLRETRLRTYDSKFIPMPDSNISSVDEAEAEESIRYQKGDILSGVGGVSKTTRTARGGFGLKFNTTAASLKASIAKKEAAKKAIESENVPAAIQAVNDARHRNEQWQEILSVTQVLSEYDGSYWVWDRKTSFKHYNHFGQYLGEEYEEAILYSRYKDGNFVVIEKPTVKLTDMTYIQKRGVSKTVASYTAATLAANGGSGGFGAPTYYTENSTAAKNSTEANAESYINHWKSIAGNTVTSSAKGGGFGDTTINGVPYYSQNDSRWKNVDYSANGDSATLGDAGCGPAALSMVTNYFGSKTNPVEVARMAQQTGYRDDSGTNWDFINRAASNFGIATEQVENPSGSTIASELMTGNPVILSGVRSGSGADSPYTRSGHYVVATGLNNDGTVNISDPRGKSYSKPYDLNKVANETGSVWGFSGGFGKRASNIMSRMKNKKKRRFRGGRGQMSADEARLALIKWMAALYGNCRYSQGGDRNSVAAGLTTGGACDCSSLQQWVYRTACHIEIGDNTRSQWASGATSVVDNTIDGHPNYGALRMGDLVYWDDGTGYMKHVEMYIGNGMGIGIGSPTTPGPRMCNVKANNDGACKTWAGGGRYYGTKRFIQDGGTYDITLPDPALYKQSPEWILAQAGMGSGGASSTPSTGTPTTPTTDTTTDTSGATTDSTGATVNTDSSSGLTATTTTKKSKKTKNYFDVLGSLLGEVGSRYSKAVATGNFSDTDFTEAFDEILNADEITEVSFGTGSTNGTSSGTTTPTTSVDNTMGGTDYIGRYVKMYESGNNGSHSIAQAGPDWGMSYGSYAFTLRFGNVINFLKKYYPDLAKNLYYNGPDVPTASWPGASYCSSPDEVTSVWKAALAQDGDLKFFQKEHAGIAEICYIPARDRAKSKGFNTDAHSRALQESLWSWAVREGPEPAANALVSLVNQTTDTRTALNRIYDYRQNSTGDGERYLANPSYAANSERLTLLGIANQAPFTGGDSNLVTLTGGGTTADRNTESAMGGFGNRMRRRRGGRGNNPTANSLIKNLTKNEKTLHVTNPRAKASKLAELQRLQIQLAPYEEVTGDKGSRSYGNTTSISKDYSPISNRTARGGFGTPRFILHGGSGNLSSSQYAALSALDVSKLLAVLQIIAENTSESSDKLDYLQNIQNQQINLTKNDGSNIVIPGSSNSGSTGSTTPSKNMVLAQLIAASGF